MTGSIVVDRAEAPVIPRQRRGSTLRDSLATWDACQDGRIGPRGVTQQQWAKDHRVSKATVTLWKRVGQAVAEVGVDPRSRLYRVLAFQGAANNRHVSREIQRYGATVESLEKVVARYYSPKIDYRKPRVKAGQPCPTCGRSQ